MKGSTNASARPNIRIQDASAEFVANTDTSTSTEFPYRASVAITGVTHYMSATVIYSQAQCTSGKYASYCQTYDGGVYIYAKTDVGTQTIPAISCDISVNYINVENVPTSGSQSVITSGGVYTALAGKVSGSGNVGSDTKPVKIVNGQAVAVTYDLTKNTLETGPVTLNTNAFTCIDAYYVKFGRVVIVDLIGVTPLVNAGDYVVVSNVPQCDIHSYHDAVMGGAGTIAVGNIWMNPFSTEINLTVTSATIFWKSFIYFSNA